MRLLIQRVSRAHVRTDGDVVGEIDRGLCILFGAGEGDNEQDLEACIDKTIHLRIFPDDDGRMDRSVIDVGGEILVVPQFTLYADVASGRRPGFTEAMNPGDADEMFQAYADRLANDERLGGVERGVFGASMDVSLVNDGPVTIWVDSAELV
jgi:D-tyrosyl-tRNA(Tyr) deacylase